jgi:hypothetical protein
MSSPDPIPTTLPEQLRHLGLTQTATDLNDVQSFRRGARLTRGVRPSRMVETK